MTDVAVLWLPILLSAVFVFVVSSVIHMVLPIHKGDYARLPDEDGTLAALRAGRVGPGQYMFPRPSSMKDMSSPEMQAKYRQGPVGTLIVRSDVGMNAALVQWFVFSVVVSVFVGYVTGLACGPGSTEVFRVAATVATLGYAFSSVDGSIWKGVSWSTTLKYVIDGVVYALVTGATFAWLWPTA